MLCTSGDPQTYLKLTTAGERWPQIRFIDARAAKEAGTKPALQTSDGCTPRANMTCCTSF